MTTFKIHVIDTSGRYLPGYYIAVPPQTGDRQSAHPVWYRMVDGIGPLTVRPTAGRRFHTLVLAGPADPDLPGVHNYYTQVPVAPNENREFRFVIPDIPGQAWPTVPKDYVDQEPVKYSAGDPYACTPAAGAPVEEEPAAPATEQELGPVRVTINAIRNVQGLHVPVADALCFIAFHSSRLPLTPITEIGASVSFRLRKSDEAAFVYFWRAGQDQSERLVVPIDISADASRTVEFPA